MTDQTPLQLAPIVGAQMIVAGEWDIAIIEDKGRALLLTVSRDGNDMIVPAARARWNALAPHSAPKPVLAWRTWTGPWHVIDDRASALLPQVDTELDR